MTLAPLRIAMVGTRGVPASYGGFETAVEEIGSRLAERGHRVTVYCRSGRPEQPHQYRGMHLVWLPSLKFKVAETLTHTAFSVLHLVFRKRPNATFVFNAANSPFLPLLRLRGARTAVHVDGLEWKRAKWSGSGQRYYRRAEEWSVRFSDALISDAAAIADYYRAEFDVPTACIAYGAPILEDSPSDRLAELGVEPGNFHVVVARFEPENHVEQIVEGYKRSAAKHPLVVVGGAPYAADYTKRIKQLAAADPRVQLTGPIYDQALLDQLYGHALTYIHGHSVGGTNPSLLRAMGAGTAVLGWDVVFNREVAGPDASYFSSPIELSALVDAAEANPAHTAAIGAKLRERAAANYNWDAVADAYEALAVELAAGQRRHPKGRRRNTNSRWGATDATEPEPKAAVES